MGLIARFIELCLEHTPTKLIEQRHYDPELVKKFGIGFCGLEVYPKLITEFGVDALKKEGFISSGKYKYVNRAIFKYDAEYFSARSMEDVRPKEKNYFPKGLKKRPYVLRGSENILYVAEGETDAVALKHLFPNAWVMGIGGVTMKKYVSSYIKAQYINDPKIVLAFDKDEFGLSCRNDVIHLLRKYKQLFFLDWESATCHDVDECFRNNVPLQEKNIIDLVKPDTYYSYPQNMEAVIENVKSLLSLHRDRQATEVMARYLTQKYHMHTIRSDMPEKEMWVYVAGIYVPHGASYIESECRSVLGDKYAFKFTKEVKDKIRADTYIDNKLFFKEEAPQLVCIQNGILDMKTKELIPHSHEKRFFNKLPIEYDKKADCPNIKKFFSEILEYPEDVDAMQELFGYLPIRDAYLEKFVIFDGAGRNGKSKTIALMKAFLGVENVTDVSIDELNNESYETSELHGKLANLSGDVGDKPLEKINGLTKATGRDPIGAKRKFKDKIYFVVYAKNIFALNKIPPITSKSDLDAFWLRVLYFGFPMTFLPPKEYAMFKDKPNVKLGDAHILDKLTTKEELSGLLNWAMAGYDRLCKKHDFSTTRCALDVKIKWVQRSNSFEAFFLEHLTYAEDVTIKSEKDSQEIMHLITKETLKRAYKAYCMDNKLKEVTDWDIKRYLNGQGVYESRKIIGTQVQVLVWIRIKPKTESYLRLQPLQPLQGFFISIENFTTKEHNNSKSNDFGTNTKPPATPATPASSDENKNPENPETGKTGNSESIPKEPASPTSYDDKPHGQTVLAQIREISKTGICSDCGVPAYLILRDTTGTELCEECSRKRGWIE